MFFPLLILGGFGWIAWQAIRQRHAASDPAAILPGSPPPQDLTLPVAISPPATVMPAQSYGLPATGPSLSPQELEDATAMAGDVETDIQTNGANYNRQIMASFQRIARLTVDGLYGGRTAGAVRYYLGRNPPDPIYNPLTEVPYSAP